MMTLLLGQHRFKVWEGGSDRRAGRPGSINVWSMHARTTLVIDFHIGRKNDEHKYTELFDRPYNFCEYISPAGIEL